MRQLRATVARAAVLRLRRWYYFARAVIYVFAWALWCQNFCISPPGLGSRPRPILRATVSSGLRLEKGGFRVSAVLRCGPRPVPTGSARWFKPTGSRLKGSSSDHELPPGLLRGIGGPRRAGGTVRGPPGSRPGRGPQHRRADGQHRPTGRGGDLATHLGGLAVGPTARRGGLRPCGGDRWLLAMWRQARVHIDWLGEDTPGRAYAQDPLWGLASLPARWGPQWAQHSLQTGDSDDDRMFGCLPDEALIPEFAPTRRVLEWPVVPTLSPGAGGASRATGRSPWSGLRRPPSWADFHGSGAANAGPASTSAGATMRTTSSLSWSRHAPFGRSPGRSLRRTF